ncbi:response regulator [Eubacterium sp. 1001713B170207_170306_E7]|uniref:response regulator n=1 Tax=Eubacterium sp. 1001713B170207_170306_E7 TaxID=2787097 RepID=UPI0018987807|nr:response regulator [Eubacterium sp. 1001713B170207_170306_E7]
MIRAVIVDDEPAVSEILTFFIEKNELPIEIVGVADDGREALTLIDQEKPRLVFLDIQMPIMNGFEVMQQTQSETSFIIITAFESFSYAQKALRLGAKDILLKPIQYEQFTEALTRAIGWQFTGNATVNGVLEYIHSHYADKIDLPTLANTFYSTPSQIARLFKKYMDSTVMTYVHKVRIEKAVALLESGDASVKEAALLTGYESLNNFYKYFKQHTGMTPAVFCEKKQTP